MDALCRVCIDIAIKSTPLNTKIENSSSLSFLEFLNKCTSLNACESDNLPQRLCSICTRSMKRFYSFVKLAEKSNKILREELKNSIATRKCSDNRQISCGEITTTKGKIDTSENSTGSPLYIRQEGKKRKSLKKGPPISTIKSIAHFKDAEINKREKFNRNIDHSEARLGEPADFVSYIDRRLANIDAVPSDNLGLPILDRQSIHRSGGLIDKNEISCEEVTVTNETIEDESEDFNSDDSFHCQTSKSSTGSSPYTLDIVKEEPRISEDRSIVDFKDAKINERIKFHYYRDHPEGNNAGPEDILSYIDRRLASIDAEHSDSDDDVPISLLKRKLIESNDEGEYSSKEFRTPSKVKKKTDRVKAKSKEAIKEEPSDLQSYFCSDRLTCDICNRVFKTKADYKNHINMHRHAFRNQVSSEADDDSLKPHRHAEKTFKCKQCGVICNHKEEFRIHCLNYKIDDKHEYKICEKDFARRKNCSQHLLPRVENKKYICPICGKGYNHLSNRWTHVKIHGDKKPECQLCGKIFSTKQYLNVHMENHKGLTKKCHQCGKVLKNSVTLQRHLKWHNNIKPFKCESCGKSYATKYMYNHHMTICINKRTKQEASFHSNGNVEEYRNSM